MTGSKALKKLTHKFRTAAEMAGLTSPYIDRELNEANQALAEADSKEVKC